VYLQLIASRAASAHEEIRGLTSLLLREVAATLQPGSNAVAALVKGLPACTYVLLISHKWQRLTRNLVVQP
jgi:hypothetical protein